MEETGIEAKVGKLLFIQQFNSEREGRDEELEFFFHIENPEDFDVIDLANTSHGLEEIAHIEFIDPAAEYIYLPFFQPCRLVSISLAISPSIFITS